MADDVALYKEALIEAAAEADDDLINKYLEGEELTDDEIKLGIQKAAASGSAVFVFCGSATNNIGIKPLLDFVVDCAAGPETNFMVKGKNIATSYGCTGFQDHCRSDIGRLTMFRLYTGK
jgi:elongation factor G